MREEFCVAVGEDERQFVGEPFTVVQDPGPILFLLFPMVRELYRAPVGDVAVFSFAEYPVEHSRGTKQAVSVSSRKMGPNVVLLGGKYAA